MLPLFKKKLFYACLFLFIHAKGAQSAVKSLASLAVSDEILIEKMVGLEGGRAHFPVWGDFLSLEAEGNLLNRFMHSEEITTNWVKISPSLNYSALWSHLLSVGLGGYYAIPIKTLIHRHVDSNGQATSREWGSVLNSDYGLTFLLSGKTRISASTLVLIEGRYNYGLTNILNPSGITSLSSLGLELAPVRELQLSIGIGFEMI